MSFESDVRRFEKDVIAGSETVIKNVFIRAGRRTINVTPVRTGLARSNWFSAYNSISTKKTDKTRGKAARLREVLSAAKLFKLGGFLSITNNLPYINRLEDGYSKQAPVGMVKVTYSLLDRWIKTETRKLR